MAAIQGGNPAGDPADKRLNDNLLEAMVEASMQGHELGSWTQVEKETYEATCQRCAKHVRVSAHRIRSTLAARCPTRGTLPRIIHSLRAAAHVGDVERFEQAYHTLLAHFSAYTYRQIAADQAFADKAWDDLPEEHQRRIVALRRILDGKLTEAETDQDAAADAPAAKSPAAKSPDRAAPSSEPSADDRSEDEGSGDEPPESGRTDDEPADGGSAGPPS